MFGEVPSMIDPEPVNIPKSPASEIYAQIASDMKTSIELFHSVKFLDINSDKDLGGVTKRTAEA